MKKMLAVMLSVLMLFTVMTPALVFAEENENIVFSTPTGSTEAECIANAVEGIDYTISEDGNTYTVLSADGLIKVISEINTRIANNELIAGRSKVTLRLGTDIDLGLKFWLTPINNTGGAGYGSYGEGLLSGFTLDGQNHTIKGYKIKEYKLFNGRYYYYGFIRAGYNLVVRNITFENCSVSSPNGDGIGIVVGCVNDSGIFINVNVNNCSIRATEKAGVVVGFSENNKGTFYFIDCHTNHNFIFGAMELGGLAGLMKNKQNSGGTAYPGTNVYVSNCTVTDIIFGVNKNDHYIVKGKLNCSDLNQHRYHEDIEIGAEIYTDLYLRKGSGWQYYWGGPSQYWNSYGATAHDCSFDLSTLTATSVATGAVNSNNIEIANSEIPIGSITYIIPQNDIEEVINNKSDTYGIDLFDEDIMGGWESYTAYLTTGDPKAETSPEIFESGDIVFFEEKPSTCNETGIKAYYLNENTGEKLYEDGTKVISDEDLILPIDPNNHEGEIETTGAVAPTCTEIGHTGTAKWSCCGVVVSEDEILPALGHDWGEWTVTVPVSYGSDGEEQRVCSVCGETETRVISVDTMSGRTIQFTNMQNMYYVVHMGNVDRYIYTNSKAIKWYEEVDLTFDVVLGSGYGHDSYVISFNNKVMQPNADGSYTIPAGSERVVVTIVGAKFVPDDASGSSQGKLSFWELLVRFFRSIADFFKNLF